MRKLFRNFKKVFLFFIFVVFDRVVVDILGFFFVFRKGNWYICVFSDYLFCWCEVFLVFSVEVSVIVCFLVDDVFFRYGVLKVLFLDREKNFLFKFIVEVCKIF